MSVFNVNHLQHLQCHLLLRLNIISRDNKKDISKEKRRRFDSYLNERKLGVKELGFRRGWCDFHKLTLMAYSCTGSENYKHVMRCKEHALHTWICSKQSKQSRWACCQAYLCPPTLAGTRPAGCPAWSPGRYPSLPSWWCGASSPPLQRWTCSTSHTWWTPERRVRGMIREYSLPLMMHRHTHHKDNPAVHILANCTLMALIYYQRTFFSQQHQFINQSVLIW